MCALEIAEFLKHLHLLALPSTLWAVHVDPDHQFIAIVHVNVAPRTRISVDKGVALFPENCTLKASISLNGEPVHLPNFSSNIETVTDLTNLVHHLEQVPLCTKCSKYNSCDSCAVERKQTDRELDLEVLDFEVEENSTLEQENGLKSRDKGSLLCTVCGRTFNSQSSLSEHMLTHASSSDKPFRCKVCDKAFAKKYNLNVHTRVHSGERPYVCSKCGKTYSTRSNLSTHMNSAHCDQKRHNCELCEMSFVHPRILRIHMRKHTGERPFMCQVCGKVFAKNVHLTVHTRIHTGEKPYVCSVCGRSFTTTGNLNAHKRINHKGAVTG